MLSYILWDQSADLFSWGQFTLRWNGLLLILAFVVGRIVIAHLYKREGKPTKDLDVLSAFLLVGIVLGARLGHVVFYQPQLWAKPLTIFFPFEFKPTFHFMAMDGFSMLGGALGILVSLWLYSLMKREGQNYRQVLDLTSITAVWITVPILVGSFLNSEVEGKATTAPYGIVFVKPITNGLEKLSCCIMRNPGGKNPVNSVIASKGKDAADREGGHHTLGLYFFFKKDTPMQMVDEFLLGDVKTYLYDQSKLIYEPGTIPLHYAIFTEPNGDFDARVRTIGIARYPLQLFEAAANLALVIFLFWYWNRNQKNLPAGRIFGLCMTLFWILQFTFEFIRDDQTPLIKGLDLNKVQVIAIPLILIGLVVLVRSFIQKEATKAR